MAEEKKSPEDVNARIRHSKARLQELVELEKAKKLNRKLEVKAEGVLRRGFWRTLFPKNGE